MKYLGRIEEAIIDFNKAIEINPQFGDAFIFRGSYSLFYLVERNEEFIKNYSKAIELDSKDANAYYYRGFYSVAFLGRI